MTSPSHSLGVKVLIVIIIIINNITINIVDVNINTINIAIHTDKLLLTNQTTTNEGLSSTLSSIAGANATAINPTGVYTASKAMGGLAQGVVQAVVAPASKTASLNQVLYGREKEPSHVGPVQAVSMHLYFVVEHHIIISHHHFIIIIILIIVIIIIIIIILIIIWFTQPSPISPHHRSGEANRCG